MLIDVHAHIGAVADRSYDAEILRQYATTCRVDVVLVSCADRTTAGEALDEADANAACLKACEANPRFAPLYWVRPGRFDSHPQAFAGALGSAPFVGAVFCPALHGYELDDEARLDPYMTALSRVRRPAVIALSGSGPVHGAHVYAFARKWSKTPLVLCGALGCAGRDDLLDTIRHASKRGDAAIYVDTAHADADEIARATAALGARRVLFGTDACGGGMAQIAQTQRLLRQLRETLPADAYARVTAENARELFGVEVRHLPV